MLLLGVTLILLIIVSVLWVRQLVPWARIAGTVADWTMVGVTSAGFVLTFYALLQNSWDADKRAQAEHIRKEDSERADAARVAVKWSVEPSSEEDDQFSKYLVATVGNFGSGPVIHAYLRLNIGPKPGWSAGDLHDYIDGIFPNSSVQVRFPVYGSGIIGLSLARLEGFRDKTELGFRDIHGQDWRLRGTCLERVSAEDALERNQWRWPDSPTKIN